MCHACQKRCHARKGVMCQKRCHVPFVSCQKRCHVPFVSCSNVVVFQSLTNNTGLQLTVVDGTRTAGLRSPFSICTRIRVTSFIKSACRR